MDSPNILDTIDQEVLQKGISSVSDRYFEHRYCAKVSQQTKDGFKVSQETKDSFEETNDGSKVSQQTIDVQQRISFHSNRICMVSLAPDHPIISEDKNITKINCAISDKVDRLKNTVSGKGKRGAQKLEPNSVICYIECDDGSKYPVYSCIKGKLVEMNDALFETPSLLKSKPASEGFIALSLPQINCYEEMKNSMMTFEEYCNR